MPKSHSLLLATADADARESLALQLEADGYRVLPAGDGVSAVEIARHHAVALAVLDLALLRLDGLDVCRYLRAHSTTADIPVLMLVAPEHDLDAIVSLELGADDYLTTPVRWSDLQMRVRVLLRRRGRERPREDIRSVELASLPTIPNILKIGDLRINVDGRFVTRNGRDLDVPALCFDLLLYLIRHSDTALSREQLWTDVWGAGARNDIRTVDVQIHMLRKLIEDDPATPRRILTVPRIGYLFRREVDVSFEAS